MKTIHHTTTEARVGKTIAKRRQVFWVALALALVTVFFGCDLFGAKGVTIEERINMFMKDVNAGNYSNLWKHIHPDAELFDEAKSADYWSKPGVFPSSEKYTLGLIIPAGDLVTTTINSSTSYNGNTIIFKMKKDGDDYKILKITIDETPILWRFGSRRSK